MSVNKAILVGRVGANPELKNFDGGTKVVNFSLATSEYFKDKAGVRQQKTEWHNVVAWSTLAEIVAKNVVKGSELYVEGKIVTRSWDDKDGVKKYTTEIVASEVRFLGSKKSEEGETTSKSTPDASAKAPTKTATPVMAVAANDVDDDLPF